MPKKSDLIPCVNLPNVVSLSDFHMKMFILSFKLLKPHACVCSLTRTIVFNDIAPLSRIACMCLHVAMHHHCCARMLLHWDRLFRRSATVRHTHCGMLQKRVSPSSLQPTSGRSAQICYRGVGMYETHGPSHRML